MKYNTILSKAYTEITIQRSRFIAYAAPVTNEDEAVRFISEINKKHPDARHIAYAYLLREPQVSRHSDAGEPQGTAGLPILDAIKGRGLSDVAVAVVRYFGGTLLGTGGLVRAYSSSVLSALDAAESACMTLCSVFEVTVNYADYSAVTVALSSLGGRVINADFLEQVIIELFIPTTLSEKFIEVLADATHGRATQRLIGERYATA